MAAHGVEFQVEFIKLKAAFVPVIFKLILVAQ
jgi:hypothetical protein